MVIISSGRSSGVAEIDTRVGKGGKIHNETVHLFSPGINTMIDRRENASPAVV